MSYFMKPLVSILIPAHNAEATIGETIRSALSQTWQRKEIIVIDDGSTDRTPQIARRFASKQVAVVSTDNHGLSAAVNNAYKLCHGDYIQELDADDILAPDKIEKQLGGLREGDTKRTLLSSPWAFFYFRTSRAQFARNSLWNDLSPAEWLIAKMSENLHMQNATWLVSRELAEAAGPWDTRLRYDQDGEYFLRVLLHSAGTRFVPEAKVFYRASGRNRISFIGNSDIKKKSLLRSMRAHIHALRSLEESERVRQACLAYMQTWFHYFCPEQPDIVEELQTLAAELDGHLEEPTLRGKYAWIKPIFGWKAARRAQTETPLFKASMIRYWDKLMYRLENPRGSCRLG
jgi:glycosyltransferase involved in cell wall biosynthesis